MSEMDCIISIGAILLIGTLVSFLMSNIGVRYEELQPKTPPQMEKPTYLRHFKALKKYPNEDFWRSPQGGHPWYGGELWADRMPTKHNKSGIYTCADPSDPRLWEGVKKQHKQYVRLWVVFIDGIAEVYPDGLARSEHAVLVKQYEGQI